MTCHTNAASGDQTTKRDSYRNREASKVSRTGLMVTGYPGVNANLKKKSVQALRQAIGFKSCVVIRITGDFLKKRVKPTRNISRVRAKKVTSSGQPNLTPCAHSNHPYRGVRLLGGG